MDVVRGHFPPLRILWRTKKVIALQSISGGYFDVDTTSRKGVMPTFYKTLGYN